MCGQARSVRRKWLGGAACVSGERQQAVGDEQGAGIDEWIARASVLVFELNKRIEPRTRIFTHRCVGTSIRFCMIGVSAR
jgi:hypothetical protein